MGIVHDMTFLLALVLGCWTGTQENARRQPIDVEKSTVSVHVSRSGVFSAFGHDHDIAAPIANGGVDLSAQPSVELRVDARALRVRDSKVTETERADIEKTMLGPEALASGRYPEIAFRSTAVQPSGSGAWSVRGSLTLHGQSQPITVDVTEKAGHYVGSALLK